MDLGLLQKNSDWNVEGPQPASNKFIPGNLKVGDFVQLFCLCKIGMGATYRFMNCVDLKSVKKIRQWEEQEQDWCPGFNQSRISLVFDKGERWFTGLIYLIKNRYTQSYAKIFKWMLKAVISLERLIRKID